VLERTGANVVLDDALLTKKLIDFEEVGVKILLLYVPVPKFDKVLFDVATDASAAGLPKLKVGVAVLGVEDTTFSKDSVFVTAGAIDTIFVCSAVVLATKFVSFVLRTPVVGTFNCAVDVVFGKLKVVSDFVSTFVLGLDEEKPLGTMAAVDSGVVLMFVVVVEELRVAQLTGCMTGGVIVLTSSA